MAYIELKNVSFSYPDANQPAIHNLSLQVEKGQFIVLFGASGSGKSTLLRLLKKEIMPHGELSGEILLDGGSIENQAVNTGFVFQDPENQVVADNVLHEMVFGLENIGLSTNEMRSRIAEMVHYFDAENLLNRDTHELSGGMKQQINLASVLLMQPDILLLDEPTAQLDPVSAREFLNMLVHLNEEFGMTIILAEHRLEEIFLLADSIVLMDKGEVKVQGETRQVLENLWRNPPFNKYVPSIPSLYLSLGGKEKLPLSVKEGRSWTQTVEIAKKDRTGWAEITEEILNAQNIYFQYQKDDGYILKELNLSIRKGDFYALLGGNGSGKSTLLKLLAGVLKPERGKLIFRGKQLKAWKNKSLAAEIGYLPQNPKLFFIQDTVEKEIQDTLEQWGLKNEHEVAPLLEKLGINHLRHNHPYDLSGGELQKAALACLLLRKPEILLLDEPTKGLDPLSKDHLADILCKLNCEGVSILMSTHDVEFAARYASKCGMMFQGSITSESEPDAFFSGNFFYTTMVQRLFRSRSDQQIVTLEEAVELCRLRR